MADIKSIIGLMLFVSYKYIDHQFKISITVNSQI